MEARANTDARVSPEERRSLADTTDSGTSDSKNHVSWVTSGVITQEDKDEAYEKTAKIVETYSDETIKKWNDEIDNLLVFAALYSGILTAFNVQSYPYLQPPTPDTTLAILQQISLQLNSFTTSPPFTNSTHVTPIATTVQVPQPPLWVVTLNVLWFWALIISLAVAYFALMVQQWLREYQNRCSGTSREYARLRQHRLNNLIAWHVSWIVGILPVLLQASLSLFFAGLLVLLWHFHSTVAIFASALVGIVMFFVLLLTILPVLRSDCSYLSPPGIPLLYAKQSIMFVVNAASVWLFSLVVLGAPLLPRCVNITDAQLSVLNDWWIKWQHNISHAHIFTTRHGEELAITHKSSSKLDVDTIVFGYHATMSLDHVSTLVPILIDQTPDEVDRCLTSICELRNRHHSILERARDISIELRKPFKHGWSSYLGESFRLLDLQHRRTVLFMLSAAVMARGHDTIPALKDLADIFRNHNDACQEMEWEGTLEHVATAIVKLTQHYLDYKVVTEISSLHSAFYLFRWVWEHRTKARGHREFFPLALRMGGHLHSSLGTAILHPDVDAHRNAFVLKSLTETLQFLSHDTHGLNLVAGLHAGAKATVERMSAQADSLPAGSSVKQEFDGLKERLRTISASKNFGHQGSQHATFSPVPDSVNLNAAGPGPSTVMLRYGADLNRQGKSLRAREGYTTSPQPTPKSNPSPQPMLSDSERVQKIVQQGSAMSPRRAEA